MASNSFGTIFKCTTWGESHGKAIGVVIDGCPAGLELSESDLHEMLQRRRPGQSPYTSPREEEDKAEILSGLFEGKTTGAPLSIILWNKDADSSKYEPVKHLLRPGHANFTYLEKYGCFDWRGGGRASARETAARVAAGAVAKKLIAHYGITLFCEVEEQEALEEKLKAVMKEGDSLGGIVSFTVEGIPIGLGDPIYEKLEANLAKAMLSLPASKGFEIGEGFKAAFMKGSEHNDLFHNKKPLSNHAGGTLGGISTGLPIIGKVAFKPASSIKLSQQTSTLEGEDAEFTLPEGSRHDPSVAFRAVPVVEAMLALVVADALLLNRVSKV